MARSDIVSFIFILLCETDCDILEFLYNMANIVFKT